jgi:hypothetical protein
MTNWKCKCGAVNFATDAICKRCQLAKTSQPLNSFSPPVQEFTEHSASDGKSASDGLKLIGVLALVVCTAAAALLVYSNFIGTVSGTAKNENLLVIAALLFGQGLMTFSLFYGLGVLIENTVAIRKNTQHLAGIRANTFNRQEQSTWQ